MGAFDKKQLFFSNESIKWIWNNFPENNLRNNAQGTLKKKKKDWLNRKKIKVNLNVKNQVIFECVFILMKTT